MLRSPADAVRGVCRGMKRMQQSLLRDALQLFSVLLRTGGRFGCFGLLDDLRACLVGQLLEEEG